MKFSTRNKLYSQVLPVLLALTVTFSGGADKKKPAKADKPAKHFSLKLEYDELKIGPSSILAIALPHTAGSGKTQIVAGCFESGEVALYEQSKHKLNKVRTIGKVNGGITDIKLISMDGGHNKVAVANDNKGTIRIFDLKNDVEPIVLFNGPHGIDHMEIADFNNDGLGDIIATGVAGQTKVWFENVDNKKFVKRNLPIVFKSVSAVHVMDFDQDGDTDMLMASDYLKTISLLTNDGKGNFIKSGIIGGVSGILDIDALDIDMDGDQDVVYTSYKEKRVQLLVNQQDGFERKNLSTKMHSLNNVEVFDLGNDGRPDLVISSYDDNAVRIIENSAAGLFEHQFQTDIPAPSDIEVRTDRSNNTTKFYISSLVKNKIFTVDVALSE